MIFFEKKSASISTISRVFIALLGGFLLANLIAILISYFSPDNKIDAIVVGMMLSFIVYAAVAIYAFSTKKARSAAIGVFGLCLAVFSIIAFIETVFTS